MMEWEVAKLPNSLYVHSAPSLAGFSKSQLHFAGGLGFSGAKQQRRHSTTDIMGKKTLFNEPETAQIGAPFNCKS